MPGAASLLPELLDAVVDTLRPLEQKVQGLVVMDGVEPKDFDNLVLFVGVDDVGDEDRDPEDEGGFTTLTYAALGQGTQNDSGSIPCVIAARSGDPGLSALRLRARDVMDAVVAALAAAPQSPWLGVRGALYGSVTSTRLRQWHTDDGPEVQLPFTITYRARR